MTGEFKYQESKTNKEFVRSDMRNNGVSLQDNRDQVLQPKWLDDGSGTYRWDVPVSGVEWYYETHTKLMYYRVVSPEGDKYKGMSGYKNARLREKWVTLYGSDPLKHQSGRVIPDDEVFTDSEDEMSEDDYDGLRLMKPGKSSKKGVDRAEFDRIKFGRRKIYEDKLAEFDQSKMEEKYRRPEAEVISSWIQKQVIKKVSSKLTAIGAIDKDGLTVRCHEKSGYEPDIILRWFKGTRHFKIVVAGESPLLRGKLQAAVLELRAKFPEWRITAKLGDPVAREDHDRMHGKGKDDSKV